MNKFYTYELSSSDLPNVPFYIGKGFNKRMFRHEKDAKKNRCKNKYLQNKILSILKNDHYIIYKKLIENVSEEEAIKNEIGRIVVLKIMGFKLCNLTNGGDGLSGHTPWNKGLKNCYSEETLYKMKINSKGKNSYLRTEETKLKMKNSWKLRKPITKEHRKNLSIALTGKRLGIPLTEEHKKKISITLKNKYLMK